MCTHILTQARELWGCPPFKPLVRGEGLCFCHTFFKAGGLDNYLGGGVGLRGLGGSSVLRFTGGFLLDFIDVDEEMQF